MRLIANQAPLTPVTKDQASFNNLNCSLFIRTELPTKGGNLERHSKANSEREVHTEKI
jgi:hypothetical protein